jgi:aspartyl-tRNA(Asn)/glutamyl-tRNA(Gln) amidotransferase subunit A
MNDNTSNLLWHVGETGAPQQQGTLGNFRILIRPNLSVAGWPVNAGSKALDNYHPYEDAAVVKRIRDQGARLVGMSRMSELGFGITGETSHRVLLDKHCNAFLGTDAAGEIRYLAAMAGAWGFKPSFGICSNLGAIRLIPSMECIGVIADDPAGIAAIVSIACEKETGDFSMLWERLPDFSAAGAKKTGSSAKEGDGRIGILKEQMDRLDETDKKAVDQAISCLRKKGLHIKTVSFPEYALFQQVHQVVGSVEASSSAGKYDGVRYGHRVKNADNWNEMYMKTRQEAFGPLLKAYLFQGAFFQFTDYKAFEHACRLRNLLIKKTAALFEQVDFIASPVRRSKMDAACAKTVDDVYNAFEHTVPANVIGLPALTAPGIAETGDTDLGFQLIAPYLSDLKLLNFAMTYLSAA